MSVFIYTEREVDELRGGIDRVTVVLANALRERGWDVYYKDRSLQCYEVSAMRDFLVKNNVSVVINQHGVSPSSLHWLKKVVYGLPVKIVSVIHGSILSVAKNYYYVKQYPLERIHLGWLKHAWALPFFQRIILSLYKLKWRGHYQNLLNESSAVVVLSEEEKKDFFQMIGGTSCAYKVYSIVNLPTFSTTPESYLKYKEKSVLFVGRINFADKRVDLLLKLWHEVSSRCPDWMLYIVGGGALLDTAKGISEKLELNNVVFTGKCSPNEFYEKASIFCMTSSHEGIPMALLEAQAYGAVPVIFDSYPTAKSLIRDKEDGFLVQSFNESEYVDTLCRLMQDSSLLGIVQKKLNSRKKINREQIVDQWISLLKKVAYDKS